MSDDAIGQDPVDPSAVLAEAIDRLTADGHAALATAVQRVDEYLRDLAAAHTDIALASDRVLERGETLLSAAATDVVAARDQQPTDPAPRKEVSTANRGRLGGAGEGAA